ncbi:hypothetical protein J31TS4_18670 [Paenibacillus sp. J31TS4]|uniref:hypothetical protein n=1 Tax=Paenibacillus sp. J31TS4 TaxID=2807195 RepID=UPI001B11DD58|nr:hypothetical protein [Paenibacillus sp. J31TS4]GIP38587.1 hypothetical protein J31TS4_18670 [Paenibacillus sp. J31TS4]
MQAGDKVLHKKNKHWGPGEVLGCSKSGQRVKVRWAGYFAGWHSYCKPESLLLDKKA